MKQPNEEVLKAIEILKTTNLSAFEKLMDWFEEMYTMDLGNAFSAKEEKPQQWSIGSAKVLAFIINVMGSSKDRIKSIQYMSYLTGNKKTNMGKKI